MNFEIIKPMDKTKNNPFWLYKLICAGPFKLKPVRLTLIFCIIVHSLEMCFSLYHFVHNYHLFLQYAPMMFLEINVATICSVSILDSCNNFQMILAAVATLVFRQKVETQLENDKFWTLDSCSKKIQLENEQFIRIQSVIVVFCLIYAHILGAVVLIPNRSDKDFIHMLLVFDNEFPKYFDWLALAYKLSMVPLVYTAIVYPFLVIYNALHSYTQGKMYKELLRNLTSDFEITPELMYDSEFQKTVQKRLRFCIERQVEIITMRHNTNKELVGPLYPVITIGAYLFCLGALFMYLGVNMKLYELNLRNGVILVTFGLALMAVFCTLYFAGQSLEDDSENLLAEIQNFDWYVWNYENRMAMLLMLTTKTTGLRFSEEFCINYTMGMKMCQSIYSVISIFASFRK